MNLVPGNSLMHNVVVQFYPWFKLYFPLFLGMIVYDDEFDTKENKVETKDETQRQLIRHLSSPDGPQKSF